MLFAQVDGQHPLGPPGTTFGRIGDDIGELGTELCAHHLLQQRFHAAEVRAHGTRSHFHRSSQGADAGEALSSHLQAA
ncbi:hypothetical protein ACFYOF_33050 [Streptomyces sp. NPDC007148]|uniref:hypothetical protein n=1 Tax=unclassified Streptomyces TaxID=2593676 RepID=UPI0036892445